ncbi:hypothetical protein [Nitrosovibrio sp. Nv6]|uniref:hypothetical protein n=1 Tax=Nitrosovibrio sp. Nv6 TaxID=1855340 RepID=UPI00131405ED|nr:hypothetical protein [Nitrosovibrio sp. Nv6]
MNIKMGTSIDTKLKIAIFAFDFRAAFAFEANRISRDNGRAHEHCQSAASKNNIYVNRPKVNQTAFCILNPVVRNDG